MKHLLIFVLTALPFSLYAIESPLLLHTYDEGLVPQFMYHRSHCAIYTDRIVIVRNYNGVETEETRPILFAKDAMAKLQAVINDSGKGPITHKEEPTCLPYDGYTAYINPNTPSVILKVMQSQQSSLNESEAARELVLFLDAHCTEIRK